MRAPLLLVLIAAAGLAAEPAAVAKPDPGAAYRAARAAAVGCDERAAVLERDEAILAAVVAGEKPTVASPLNDLSPKRAARQLEELRAELAKVREDQREKAATLKAAREAAKAAGVKVDATPSK